MFIDLLRSRRSIRQFEKRPVEPNTIELLIEAVLRAPTSRGLNPWEFIFVTEPDTLAKLAGAKAHGSSFIKNGPLAVVVCAHPDKSDVWVEDTAIASIILHLAAADLGLGSCWVQIRQRDHDGQTSAEDYVKNLLGIEQSLVVEAVIAIGYPAETKAGHDRAALLDERISFERYGKKR